VSRNARLPPSKSVSDRVSEPIPEASDRKGTNQVSSATAQAINPTSSHGRSGWVAVVGGDAPASAGPNTIAP
jgi:hypothetical protein